MQIQLDFRQHWNGLDVLEYFEGARSWLEFHEYLNGLPSHSRFKAAVALDTDFAQRQKALLDEAKGDDKGEDEENEDGEQAWNPQMRSQEGFSPVIATMYSLLDALNENTRTVIACSGRKPPPKPRLQRPVSAMDLLELADERDDMHDLAARFGISRTT